MTTASYFQTIRGRTLTYAGLDLRVAQAKPKTGNRNPTGGSPDGRERKARLFFQLPLQLPHEIGQAGTALALEPLCL
jgi:hypothetical protein